MTLARGALAGVLAACLFGMTACADPAQQAPPPQAPLAAATVTVDATRPGAPANPLILGSNVQWVDRGDELLKGDGMFDPSMLEKAKALAPSVLRYPGGSLSDTYHWQRGLGAAGARAEGEVFFDRSPQKMLMGTDELLRLCEAVGAEPLLTVNTATGDAAEAARWVAYVNGAPGRSAPRARYWEIGNEPYLKEDKRKDLWIAPQDFARRAGEFARAMKQADPRILVGLPMRSDRLGGMPATPWPGFNDGMAGVPPLVDFVSLHNAYLPFAVDKRYGERELYLGAMAGYRVIEADFEATRAVTRKLWPGRAVKLAVTEYNALFTLGRGESDRYTATLAGALYVADVLRLFAQTPDLLLANFWSLSGNGVFGAVSNRGVRRPAYYVLQAYREAMRGRAVPVTVAGPTFDTPRVGFVPAYTGLPVVTATAFVEGRTLRVILLNKHLDSAVPVRLDAKGGAGSEIAYRTITGRNVFDTREAEDKIEVRSGRANAATLQLPAHSVTLLEVPLK